MIIRRRHTANFTTIGNALFEDERLAADEVGILAYLLSRPHDWEVRRPALMRRWNVGVVAMKRMVHNWMRTGWCHAEKVRLPNGTFHVIYEIRDQPGKELTDHEIREALSLVSSEASNDELGRQKPSDQPDVTVDPPPCHRGVADQGVVTERWPIRDIQNTELPRTDSDQIDRMPETRARGQSAFTAGSKALASAFFRALGFNGPLQIPPEFAGVDWRAVQWEQAGWTVDLIDVEARRFACDLPLKPLSYFEKVFATSFAKRQAPLPIVEIRDAEKLTVTGHGKTHASGDDFRKVGFAGLAARLRHGRAEQETDRPAPEDLEPINRH
jgi:hypothetical protein